MEAKDQSYQDIVSLIAELKRENQELKEENASLKQQLKKLKEPKKNSSNSSIPPSKDENRPKKNQSLRTSSGKKSGGQSGHKGHTLSMVSDPDVIIEHSSQVCESCGCDLRGTAPSKTVCRQVADIPPVKIHYTEHRSHSVACKCGHVSKGRFPEGVSAPIQYGRGVENLVAYLNVGQYLPYKRIASMLGNMFGCRISQGTVKNMLEKFSARLTPIYNKIKKKILLSPVVGADETGAKVNGDKWWFWAWQSKLLTYIAASGNRAFKTVEENFPDGFKNSILVSDRYGAHLKTEVMGRQLCISHLLRDANYLEQLTGSPLIKKFKQLIAHALIYKDTMTAEEYSGYSFERDMIRKQMYRLLSGDLDGEHEKLVTFFGQLNKNKQAIFEFLYNEHVPPDNNASERAIRNVKVKQKMSTQFKTEDGINAYAVIRSVYDTCIKRDIDFFNCMELNAAL